MFCLQSWTKIGFGVLAHKPVARTDHSACCISGRLNGTPAAVLISGGRRPNDTVLEDFWVVDVEEQKWRQVTDQLHRSNVYRKVLKSVSNTPSK